MILGRRAPLDSDRQRSAPDPIRKSPEETTRVSSQFGRYRTDCFAVTSSLKRTLVHPQAEIVGTAAP